MIRNLQPDDDVNAEIAFYLKMYEAWENGISTAEFRRCLTDDIMIVDEIKKKVENISKKKRIEQEQALKVNQVLENLRNGR